MLTGKLRWLSLTFCLLCITASAQEMILEPGNPVERQIAGGESHSYKINLTVQLADGAGRAILQSQSLG